MIAYFDESGTHEQSKVITLAGFIATARRWKEFEQQWGEALRKAGISSFHMSEYESRYGEFSGMDNEDRRKLIVKLASIIKNQIMFGVGVSMVVADYQEIMAPRLIGLTDPQKEPYRFCLQTCFELIVQLVEIPRSEKLAVVLDENRPIRGFIAEAFIEMKQKRQWDHLLGSLTFGSRVEVLPLQAADILAYECYKYVTNQVVEESSHPIRKLLNALKKSHRCWLGYYGRKELLDTIERVEAQGLQ